MFKASACLRADLQGLISTAAQTLSMLSSVRADVGRPVDLFYNVKPVVLNLVTQRIFVVRDGTSLWRST